MTKEHLIAEETVKKALNIMVPYPANVERLGGLTNKNYKVTFDKKSYVLRLPGVGTETMINRANEYESTLLANKLEIDARLLHFDKKTGVKISDFIDSAETMHKEIFKTDPNSLYAAAQVLKKLHTSGEENPVTFDVFEMLKEYETLLSQLNKELFWKDYEKVRSDVMMLQIELKQSNVTRVPCHNDPLCENFIRSGNRMYLVDWEYAGMNDPMWDLADFAIECELQPEEEERFNRHYLLDAYNETMIRRININKVLLDLLWSLWALLRVANGEGQEMRDWADERYARAQKNLDLLNQTKYAEVLGEIS